MFYYRINNNLFAAAQGQAGTSQDFYNDIRRISAGHQQVIRQTANLRSKQTSSSCYSILYWCVTPCWDTPQYLPSRSTKRLKVYWGNGSWTLLKPPAWSFFVPSPWRHYGWVASDVPGDRKCRLYCCLGCLTAGFYLFSTMRLYNFCASCCWKPGWEKQSLQTSESQTLRWSC